MSNQRITIDAQNTREGIRTGSPPRPRRARSAHPTLLLQVSQTATEDKLRFRSPLAVPETPGPDNCATPSACFPELSGFLCLSSTGPSSPEPTGSDRSSDKWTAPQAITSRTQPDVPQPVCVPACWPLPGCSPLSEQSVPARPIRALAFRSPVRVRPVYG